MENFLEIMAVTSLIITAGTLVTLNVMEDLLIYLVYVTISKR